MRRTVRGVAAAALATLAAGCGSGFAVPGDDDARPGRGGARAAPTTAHAGAAGSDQPLPEPETTDYTWQVELEDGSTYEVTAALGELQSYDDPALIGGLGAFGQVCDVDYDRDAFIPLMLRATSTTPGFTTEASIHLYAAAYTEDGADAAAAEQAATRISFQSEAYYPDGAVCHEAEPEGLGRHVLGVRFGEMVTGVEKSMPAWLVVKDYFSPAHPDGDREALALWQLRQLYTANDQVAALTPLSGDGIQETEAFWMPTVRFPIVA
jgi:hypothetical protein